MMNKKEINHEFNLWEKENISLGMKKIDRETMKRIAKSFADHILKLEKKNETKSI